MSTAKKRVLVAMSGGVDSSVAAYLLKKQGYEVIGITFQLYDYSRANRKEGKGGCCSVEDVDDARLIADQLGIKHYLTNSRKEFREKVIQYFVSSYKKGLTPNPCVACNTFIKFDELEYHAKLLEADYYATGHYARLVKTDSGEVDVYRAVDSDKDQSYFLMGVDRERFRNILFPCGDYSKAEIRALANEAGLITSNKKESMEICFITNNDYKSFLKNEYQIKDQPGDIVDERGQVLGRHSGSHHFTVGQRKGLGSFGLRAHYVVRIDAEKNQVVVGNASGLFSDTMFVESASIKNIESYKGRRLQVKIRSRSPEVGVYIHQSGDAEILATFEEPQRAVTPGQFAVFYDGDKLLGGGAILRAVAEQSGDTGFSKEKAS